MIVIYPVGGALSASAGNRYVVTDLCKTSEIGESEIAGILIRRPIACPITP